MLGQNAGNAMSMGIVSPFFFKKSLDLLVEIANIKITHEIAACCLKIFSFLSWLIYLVFFILILIIPCVYYFNLKGKIVFGVIQTF